MPIVDLPLKELKVYKPPLTKRKDFLKFWKENVRLSREQPLNPKVEGVSYPVRRVKVQSVTFDGFMDGTPISAWHLRPSGRGPFPYMLFLHGYGGNRGSVSDYLGWVLQGYSVMAVDVRGQSGDTPDFARYPSGSITGNMTKGILDKSNYYYRYVYMDCLRALDLLLEMDDVKAKGVGVTGASQGGGLTIVVSALDGRVTLSMPEVPYLCQFERAVEVASQGPYLEILNFIRAYPDDADGAYETLSYFDAMNFAPDLRCPTLVSVGLIDTVCPASTIFSTYNHMAAKVKELAIYPGMGHESLNVHQEKRISWSAKYLLKQ